MKLSEADAASAVDPREWWRLMEALMYLNLPYLILLSAWLEYRDDEGVDGLDVTTAWPLDNTEVDGCGWEWWGCVVDSGCVKFTMVEVVDEDDDPLKA